MSTRIFLILALWLYSAEGRTFTVTNSCPFTIWPALYTDLKAGTSVPTQPTGWVAEPNTSVSFDIPNDWKAGRIWGRRACDFNKTNDLNSCVSGGCIGGFLCDQSIGTGIPPVSLAEWTLSGDGNRDFYDVSLVDGYNLPMRIDTNVGCPVADCSVDLNPNCPEPLRGPFDSTGYPLGCKTACLVDPNPTNSPSCCSGSFATPETCPPSGVNYYSYFKNACPNAYAYAYDEGSGTALFTCDSGLNANYVLTFCPAISMSANGTTLPVSSGGASTLNATTTSPSSASMSSLASTSSSSELPTISIVPNNSAARLVESAHATLAVAWLVTQVITLLL